MFDRFYYSGEWQQSVVLSGTEAHHLVNVLRKKAGDQVELFNGLGGSCIATIESVSKRSATLQVTTHFQEDPHSNTQICLAVSPPKGDRFRWLVEKATELGVYQLIPIKTDRSIVEPGKNKIEKLEQTIIAACKQSGRNRLLEIAPVQTLQDVLVESEQWDQVLIGAVPKEIKEKRHLPEFTGRKILVVIGPEGGLTDSELNQLRERHATPFCIGSNILRVETAAIAMASWIIVGHSGNVE